MGKAMKVYMPLIAFFLFYIYFYERKGFSFHISGKSYIIEPRFN